MPTTYRKFMNVKFEQFIRGEWVLVDNSKKLILGFPIRKFIKYRKTADLIDLILGKDERRDKKTTFENDAQRILFYCGEEVKERRYKHKRI